MTYLLTAKSYQNKKASLLEIYFNILFLVYGVSIVLFDNLKYLYILYIINILLGVSFLFFIRKDKFYLNIFLKIYLIFTLLGMVSIIWSDYFLDSARRFLTLVLILINITVIYNINKKYNNYLYLIYGIFIALFVNFLWLINLIDMGLDYEGWRFQGTILQANEFAFIINFVMIMIIYISISKKIYVIHRYILLMLFVISLYMVFFTASKSGIIGSIILVGLYFSHIVHPKNFLFIILIGITGYIIITYTNLISLISANTVFDLEETYLNLFSRIEIFFDVLSRGESGVKTSSELRIKMLKDGIEMWSNKPIFGNGMAVFEAKFGGYSHNNIVELLVSVGVIGLFIYYSLHIILFIKILKIRKFKNKIMFLIFLLLFLIYDQAMVSYYGKFEVLALFILYLSIEESIKMYNITSKGYI